MSYTDDMDGPVGVGGWMYLFLFGFALVSPISLVFMTYFNLYSDAVVADLVGDGWLLYQVVEWGIAVVSIAVIGYVTWRLFNVQNPATVKLTIAAILFLNIGIMLLDVVFTSMMAAISASAIFSELSADFLRGAIYCAIWCSYFTVSKRVRNTYSGRTGNELEEVFQ